jgi:hypothetical protein
MKLIIATTLALTTLLGACSKPTDQATPTNATIAPTANAVASAATATGVAPTIDPVFAESFPDCKLTEHKAAGVSAWAFDCPATRTTQRMVEDASLPGFKLETTAVDGTKTSYPAVVVFTKAADAPITAIADQVAKVSPMDAGAACQLTDITDEMNQLLPGGPTRFSYLPTGKAKEAFDADMEKVKSPCGPYGSKGLDIMTFEELKGDPTKVVMIAWGKETQIMVPTTVAAAK